MKKKMSNIVPQPQITFENNKIYVDSPVDVKYTLDGLDPVFYGVIYTSPISISHTTTIKAISVNSLGEFSNLVAGTFTPESDVSDGSSGSTWNPSYDDAVTLEELSAMSYATTSYVVDYVSTYGGGGGDIVLDDYITYEYLDSCGYITESDVAQMGYITAADIPEVDLSSYVTYDFLSNQSYITINDVPSPDLSSYVSYSYLADSLSSYVTYDYLSSQSYISSIPSEYITSYELSQELVSYITQDELSANSYLTQHQDLVSYLSVENLNTAGTKMQLRTNGLTVVSTTNSIAPKSITYTDLVNNPSSNNWIGQTTLQNYVNGRLSDIESTYATQSYVLDKIGAIPTVDLSSYVTYSYLSDNYLPLNGGTLNGNLTLANTYFLTIGNQRAWKVFEDGSGSGAYIALQATVAGKFFRIRDLYGNNIVSIYDNNSTGNYVKNESVNTYICNIIPNSNNVYNLGNSNYKFAYTYTSSLILNGTDIVQPLSVGKIHYGTAVHDRTSYTTTCTVDSFEVDSNGNPLPGTAIAVKLTSITGTNPATLYPVKFIVNGKENSRWYGNAAQSSFGNGRNWYRDMNDGTNRYWYWFWDGNYWVWHGISDERDTTYSNMTDANMQAGTETTARLVTAKALATYYTAKSCFSFDSSTNTLTITTA